MENDKFTIILKGHPPDYGYRDVEIHYTYSISATLEKMKEACERARNNPPNKDLFFVDYETSFRL